MKTAIAFHIQSFPSLATGCIISSFLFCTEILKDGDSGLIAEQGCHLSASTCHITCYGDIGQLCTALSLIKPHMQHLKSFTKVLPLSGSLCAPSQTSLLAMWWDCTYASGVLSNFSHTSQTTARRP